MKITRDGLVKMIAEKITDAQDIHDLTEYYYTGQCEYLDQMDDGQLAIYAEDLQLLDPGESLEFEDDRHAPHILGGYPRT